MPMDPESLRKSGKVGIVIVNVLVDTTGRIDPSSIDVVQSSDAAFAQAVLEVLPYVHYQPAMAGGRKVPQQISVQYVFSWPH